MDIKSATIIVDQYRKSANSKATQNSYNGLQIHALPGLHNLIGTISDIFLKKNCTVLDLASGSGAMALRLYDLGFKVTATDYVTENFRPKSIPFTQVDLNSDFSKLFNTQFDSITAIEIIEHLENPRHFARECYKTLSPGGRIILSTPNIESYASLTTFVRSGTYAWFDDEDYSVQGHITPLTLWQLEKIFQEAGFKHLHKETFGDGLRLLNGSPRMKILGRLLSLLSNRKKNLHGEILILVMERPPTQDNN